MTARARRHADVRFLMLGALGLLGVLGAPSAAAGAATCPARASRVVFSSTDDSFGGAWGIATVGADGGDTAWLLPAAGEDSTNYRPAVSPDGSTILWDSDRSGERAIWSMACDGTAPHPWSTAGDPVEEQAPAWSPDGTMVAFVGALAGHGYGVFVAPADHSAPARRLASMEAAPGNRPAWSPDGSTLAFAGGPVAPPDIYIVSLDGSNAHRLTRGRAADGEPAWSPDGKTIAFYSDRGGGDAVWAMDAHGRHARRLASPAMGGYQPAWSPDGKTLVYVKNALGHSELWLMRPDGTHKRALTHADGHRADEAPAW